MSARAWISTLCLFAASACPSLAADIAVEDSAQAQAEALLGCWDRRDFPGDGSAYYVGLCFDGTGIMTLNQAWVPGPPALGHVVEDEVRYAVKAGQLLLGAYGSCEMSFLRSETLVLGNCTLSSDRSPYSKRVP